MSSTPWFEGLPYRLIGVTASPGETSWFEGQPLEYISGSAEGTIEAGLHADIQKLTASLSGIVAVSGNLAASLEKITANVSGTAEGFLRVGRFGSIVVWDTLNELRVGRLGALVVWNEWVGDPFSGTVNASLAPLTGNISGYDLYGAVRASIAPINANSAGDIHLPSIGSISASVAPLSANSAGNAYLPSIGSISAILDRISANIAVDYNTRRAFDLILEVSRRGPSVLPPAPPVLTPVRKRN